MLRNLGKVVLIAFLALGATDLFAAIDVYEFSSEERRERYQKFVEELRCPKCKNQNLAGTNSQIAVDLRRELHRMIEEGYSDPEIINFMVSRYGDFVLYRPRMQPNTMALWLGPLIFLVAGLLVVGLIVWRRRSQLNQGQSDLDEVERARLDALLASEKPDPKSSDKK